MLQCLKVHYQDGRTIGNIIIAIINFVIHTAKEHKDKFTNHIVDMEQ